MAGSAPRGTAPDTGFASRFSDDDLSFGHLLRDARPRGEPATCADPEPCEAAARTGPVGGAQLVDVLIVGAGIAGLAAARALRRAGIDRYQLLELGSAPGGNSRAATVGGLPCPTGAHYLPLPGPDAVEVIELLTELGVRDSAGGYDDRMLIQAPQERLFIHGVWQEGLLPLIAQPPTTLDQYRRFASEIERWRASRVFTIPVARARTGTVLGTTVADLQALTFDQWLVAAGFDAPALRWYLDYCCRDDYGAGTALVSAWAGLHYFASRHGFGLPPSLPGRGSSAAGEAMLTWPEGNGWLVARLAQPHRDRLVLRHLVSRIQRDGRGTATTGGGWTVDAVDLRDASRPTRRRWQARVVIWAAPTHVAGRVIDRTTAQGQWVSAAAAGITSAPWLVANVLVDARWRPSGGELAWDNVIYGSEALGYVNARQQRLDRRPGPALLTWYHALGGQPDARRWLADGDLDAMAARCVADIARAHPEIRPWIREIAVTRWGHAMAIPTPAMHRNAGLARLRDSDGDLLFAHTDLSGYSIFEEAMHRGSVAAARALRWLGG